MTNIDPANTDASGEQAQAPGGNGKRPAASLAEPGATAVAGDIGITSTIATGAGATGLGAPDLGATAGDGGAGGKHKDAGEQSGANAKRARQGFAATVAEIVAGVKDGRGEPIDYVYFKRTHYAVYRSGARVVTAYSDDTTIADQQIADVSSLHQQRDHLLNLTAELPQKMKGAKEHYCAQIADALRLGLEKQLPAAKAVLEEAVRDALETQARIGRLIYLKWAAGMSLVVAAVLISTGGNSIADRGPIHLLLMAPGAGAIGALLSIAIGIRARTVAIDGNWQANAMDAAVRVLIGIISSAVLFLLLNSGILADIQAGGVKITGNDIQWQAAVIVGFAAGFLERLVPDLLERSAPIKPAAAPSANNAGVVSPPGASAGKS
jgi:hypothetical protein